MERIYLWGTGQRVDDEKDFLDELYKWDIVILGFIDNDKRKCGNKKNGLPILSPDELREKDVEEVIVCTQYYEDIIQQIRLDFPQLGGKTYEYFAWKEKRIREHVLEKYRHTKDQEIIEILKYIQDKGVSVFNQYIDDKHTYSRAYFDNEHGYYYINFEGKRMYFPKKFHFYEIEGKPYVVDVVKEQDQGSPHLYMKEQWGIIKPQSVIVDAGVCEGNYALRYADTAKKIYLIEGDADWIEPLQLTFKPYKNKVILSNKWLGKYTDDKNICLDDLVKEKIDYLKMDIEGAEADALFGARNLLRESNAKCSICSYHKHGDEDKIAKILCECGYQITHSQGYMLFLYDNDINGKIEFRRGIIYGEKP